MQQIIRQLPQDHALWPGKSSDNIVDSDSMASVQLSDVQQAQLKEIFDLFDTGLCALYNIICIIYMHYI